MLIVIITILDADLFFYRVRYFETNMNGGECGEGVEMNVASSQSEADYSSELRMGQNT